MIEKLIGKLIEGGMRNGLITALLAGCLLWTGWLVSPYGPKLEGVMDRVPVDAIPDIGENQQIVYTTWPGRSPRDVEDQVTYPLTSSLLGIPGVKTIRSNSMFGFSTIYVIFDESVEFYFSRSRILEKLNALPGSTLPQGVTPSLGPDATGLGQIFWYTLEGRDEEGHPAGGWDPHELRSLQDWTVRFGLQAVEGVAEVASVGGFVQEYQVDVNPEAMANYSVTLRDVYTAIRRGNIDVGGGTIEINGPEYFIRGLGFIRSIDDLNQAVVKVVDHVPIYVGQVAEVSLGPAQRRGLLDKEGSEAVGGVVVSRFGANPLETIHAVEKRIEQIAPSLPERVLADGRTSKVTIVPFYNRAQLIDETLGTLGEALRLEVIITAIVILFLVAHLRGALLISGLLPLTVATTFLAMKWFGVDANIVALSGIAIAIGTIVDMGIVMVENILRNMSERQGDFFTTVLDASREVGGAVFTAVATTVISFLPVFFMEGAEGKLFKPLAYTKTYALMASVLISLIILPSFCLFLLRRRERWLQRNWKMLVVAWIVLLFISPRAALLALLGAGAIWGMQQLPALVQTRVSRGFHFLLILIVTIMLAETWMPLGVGAGTLRNVLFTGVLIGLLLGGAVLFMRVYPRVLRWCLDNKPVFLSIPAALVVLGLVIWLGFTRAFTPVLAGLEKVGISRASVAATRPWVWASHAFPGMGKEFMPPLDEGSFLYMPTTMPHASIGEAQEILARMDMAIRAIPEVAEVVGKLGRAETSLDPAPVSMIETIINYTTEYRLDEHGRRARFRFEDGAFVRDDAGHLIPDEEGKPYRQWRDEIRSPDDIWAEIVRVADVPGATSAPKLQPISTRLVMLQSGMRAPMGVKIKGPDQSSLEAVGLEIERLLKQVPVIASEAVLAERIVGKPYLELDIHREAIARYGLTIEDVTDVIEMAIGGKTLSYTVEGRERYAIRIRYPRELRDDLEAIGEVLVPVRGDLQIPLDELATPRYVRGPQNIKSEDAQLVSYVLFDKRKGHAEVEVVEAARNYLQEKIATGELRLPEGVSYSFAGSFENQVRSEKRLLFILPLAMGLIFVLLYLQFRSKVTTAIIFSAVFVAWSGGFLMLWLYGQDWFLDVNLLGINLRDIFGVRTYNLSVAVWVGFLALFGIATDDGVIMGTYLRQVFEARTPDSVAGIREATIEAGQRRIRPCLMTSATTILALIPILTSTGRGSDIMIPMAIPSFGGMVVVLITVFVVPTLFCWREEQKLGQQVAQ